MTKETDMAPARIVPRFASCYDALTAKLVEEAGFEWTLIGGMQLSASKGLPDLGFLSHADVVAAASEIVKAIRIPAIVDIDSGYGSEFTIRRCIEDLEALGVAGVLLEDQAFPRKCPFIAQPEVVGLAEAAKRVRTAVHVRRSKSFKIIARTDAVDLNDVCERVKCFASEGADMVYVIYRAIHRYDDLVRVRDAAGVPIMLHIHGWVEALDEAQLARVSDLAGWALPTILTVVGALRSNLRSIRATGSITASPVPIPEFTELDALLGTANYRSFTDQMRGDAS